MCFSRGCSVLLYLSFAFNNTGKTQMLAASWGRSLPLLPIVQCYNADESKGITRVMWSFLSYKTNLNFECNGQMWFIRKEFYLWSKNISVSYSFVEFINVILSHGWFICNLLQILCILLFAFQLLYIQTTNVWAL